MPFASSALMAPMTRAFVRSMESWCAGNDVPVITFRPGERKDDLAQAYLAQAYLASFSGAEGILFAGKAQEKARVYRTEKRRNPETGRTYPWISWSTAMVNAWYFYGLDAEFGPFFCKYGTYFPYTGRFCLNGHEYLKRQAARRGITFQALDNGIASCDHPPGCSGSPMDCPRPRSRPSFAGGCAGSPLPTPSRTGPLGTTTTSPSCRRSSP